MQIKGIGVCGGMAIAPIHYVEAPCPADINEHSDREPAQLKARLDQLTAQLQQDFLSRAALLRKREQTQDAEMLEMQIQLLRTNIESLEAGRGNKKVIARQKAIAKKLEQWKDRISMKMDGAEPAVKKQIATENQKLHVDRNSPIVQSSYDTTNVLI